MIINLVELQRDDILKDLFINWYYNLVLIVQTNRCFVDKLIAFEPPLAYKVTEVEGKWGVILAHGERSRVDEGLLAHLVKKLKKRGIMSLRFNFPFRMRNERKSDDYATLDQAFLAAFNFASAEYPDKEWAIGGHGIGGSTAIRTSAIALTDKGIPPVICLSYPMYPPNKPEYVNTNSLGALMGEALFCQGDKSNQGTFDRLNNQIQMMAPHSHIKRIKGANHFMEVEGKTIDTVSFWISNDIEKFLRESEMY